MKLGNTDYAFVRLAKWGWPAWKSLGDLETLLIAKRLVNLRIEQPVFIAGLARSGTTILLQELANTGLFATHRYRDFPFLTIPIFWNWFLDRFATKSTLVERPHQDSIRINAESPEAYEEPIWQQFFPEVHDPDKTHRLDGGVRREPFERFFLEHVRKLMLVRGCGRYLSKGNYNVARLEYLSKLFPDARFLVPIRHPVDQVASLVRQHRLFVRYSHADRRVPQYLAAAGHYEFGPQRQAIRLSHASGDRINAAWKRGDDALGYAMQWAAVYRFVEQLRHRDEDMAERIRVVRHEDLRANPSEELRAIFEHIHLDEERASISMQSSQIAPSTKHDVRTSDSRNLIWETTEHVARRFDYSIAAKAVCHH